MLVELYYLRVYCRLVSRLSVAGDMDLRETNKKIVRAQEKLGKEVQRREEL